MIDEGSDIVRDFLRRLLLIQPDFPPEKAQALEMEIRRDWGGERPYIAKDADRDLKREQIAAELAAGTPREEVRRRHKVSERTLYRLLNRRQ